MRVSIIVPTLNRRAFLERTLQSLLEQEQPAHEIIVVDNGSTDTTPELLRGLGSRIRPETCRERGEAHAVNRGFAVATGDLLAIVSDDDPVRPGWLATMCETFEAHPADLVAAYPDWEMIDPEDRVLHVMEVAEYRFECMVGWHCCLPGPGTVFRRTAMRRIGGREPRWPTVSDYNFFLRLALTGAFVHVPAPLATWRNHAAATTHTHRGAAAAWERVALMRDFFENHHRRPHLARLRRQAAASARIAAALLSPPHSSLRWYFFAGAVARQPGYWHELPPNYAGFEPLLRQTLLPRPWRRA